MIIPSWTTTIGAMIAEGAEVRAYCGRCDMGFLVDLSPILKKHGELYSLWDRHPPCTAKCGGRVFFRTHRRDAGMWPVKMVTDGAGEAQDLHRAWQADRDARRRADDLWRFLRKRRTYRGRVRSEASNLLLLPRGAAEEVHARMRRTDGKELAYWADVRLEVLRRLARPDRVDLEAEV